MKYIQYVFIQSYLVEVFGKVNNSPGKIKLHEIPHANKFSFDIFHKKCKRRIRIDKYFNSFETEMKNLCFHVRKWVIKKRKTCIFYSTPISQIHASPEIYFYFSNNRSLESPKNSSRIFYHVTFTKTLSLVFLFKE